MKAKLRSTSEIIAIDDQTTLASYAAASLHPLKRPTDGVSAVFRKGVDVNPRKLAIYSGGYEEGVSEGRRNASSDWPTDILYDPETVAVLGAVVPYYAGAIDLGTYLSPVFRKRDHAGIAYRSLYRIAENLARALRDVHSTGAVVGSLDPKSIFVSDTMLVKIGGSWLFQLVDPKDKKTLGANVLNSDNAAPELAQLTKSGASLTANQDIFSLAVVLFKLLANGTHPFSGTVSDKTIPDSQEARMEAGYYPYALREGELSAPRTSPGTDAFTSALRELFLQCFTVGCASPEARPALDDWVAALASAQNVLQQCGKNSLHSFDPVSDKCPWCSLTDRLGGTDPFPSHPLGEVGVRQRPVTVAPAKPIELPTAAPAVRSDSERATVNWGGIIFGSIFFLVLVLFVSLNAGWYMKLLSDEESASRSVAQVENMDPANADFSVAVKSAKDAMVSADSQLLMTSTEPFHYVLGTQYRISSVLDQKVARIEIVERSSSVLGQVTDSINAYLHMKMTSDQATSAREQLRSQCEEVEKTSAMVRMADPDMAGAWIVGIRAYHLSGQQSEEQSLETQALSQCSNKAAIRAAIESL